MLGIGTADAIALGTLILAALAAWQGRRAGDAAARRPPPPDPALALLGGALVDHLTLRDLVEAVRALEQTIGRVAEDRERRDATGFADALRRLEAAMAQDRRA